MNVINELAELEHEQWAHWTKYMLDNLTPENIARWRRQINTKYDDLSEKEKQSDIAWALKAVNILKSDGCFFVVDPHDTMAGEKNALSKHYFQLSDESKNELKEIEKEIRGNMTDEEWAFFKTIRC